MVCSEVTHWEAGYQCRACKNVAKILQIATYHIEPLEALMPLEALIPI